MSVSHPIWLHCREVVEWLGELFDDQLPPTDRVRLEQHLLVCPPCAAHLQQLRTTIDLTHELADDPPDPSAALAVLARWKTLR